MASTKTAKLHKSFLDGPAPALKRSDVNWEKGGLPEYEGLWAVILDGIVTEEECDQLVAAAEATTDGKWERAMVNIGGGKQALYDDVRNCGRIIWDDQELVNKLWARCASAVPEINELVDWPDVTGNGPAKRKETWKLSRLNERMRFLKYGPDEYFKAHCDGTYETPDKSERSYFTLHLYLNEAGEQLKGGATTFHSYNMGREIRVVPKVGRVLLFQHRGLLHSGEDVDKGLKLTLRTDIMYTKATE
ncbi:oxidoreductase domain-containing protein [Lophiotrema nucula]|uniref:Oxidoreductase domain-containing protein n=1 Tax=Lophiotrema nucula TaxID=690887 RepID=A0A6A5YYW8_9PLEO|nr:oxidoreductase domain-containing protein [Lophiotrema nucula]